MTHTFNIMYTIICLPFCFYLFPTLHRASIEQQPEQKYEAEIAKRHTAGVPQTILTPHSTPRKDKYEISAVVLVVVVVEFDAIAFSLSRTSACTWTLTHAA